MASRVLPNAPRYICSVCTLTYDEAEWALQCEAWCRAHHSCNLTITAHSREVRAQRTRRVPHSPPDAR